jgi:hypothetical protein
MMISASNSRVNTLSWTGWLPPMPGTADRLPATKSTPMVSVFLRHRNRRPV